MSVRQILTARKKKWNVPQKKEYKRVYEETLK